MEIRELRAFITVVESGGLSAAARQLHLSQSALSQTVQSLERQLGVTLLVRSNAGVRATEPGEVLLAEARALVAQHDRAVALVTSRAGATDGMIAGLIRIGVPLELPADLLPAAIGQVRLSYPDTRIEVRHQRSTAQLESLAAGDLDMALVRDRPADPNLDAMVVVREAMGVILSTSSSGEITDPAGVRLQDLAGLEWIGFARSDAPVWHDEVTATLRGHGVAVSAHAYNDNLPVIAEVKLAAVGTRRSFGLASPGWAQPLPAGLQWYPLIGNPVVRRTWAVWSAHSRHRDLAALIDVLDETHRTAGVREHPDMKAGHAGGSQAR